MATPLFSLHSKDGIGCGEFTDLTALAEWCRACGLSIIQLLPLNDMGFDFRPYDAQSSFALEPMHLNLGALRGVHWAPLSRELGTLRAGFPTGGRHVNFEVKKAKLGLLRRIFEALPDRPETGLESFARDNAFWLPDYALFRTLKDSQEGRPWTLWSSGLRDRRPEALDEAARRHASDVRFHQWVQWQCFEQLSEAKRRASGMGVLIMGDLPFLVSRDSADVWSRQDHFKLELSAGAPPDLLFSQGQRWGMPPYRWDVIAAQGYEYMRRKLDYASRFYDMFRLDHAVGVFRLWTIPGGEPAESGGRNGFFDPGDENLWESHGRNLLSVMLSASPMLPCAEDLGTVPACSPRVLAELGIPGTDVQRWTKNWDTGDFSPPESLRATGMAVLSTHDTSSLAGWWTFEAGTVDEYAFGKQCESAGVSLAEAREKLFNPGRSRHGRLRWRAEIRDLASVARALGRTEDSLGGLGAAFRGTGDERERYWRFIGGAGPVRERAGARFARAALRRTLQSASIFSIQLLQDWLLLDTAVKMDPWEFRINFPGSTGSRNWSVILPVPLESMPPLKATRAIRRLNLETGRIPPTCTN